MEIINSRVLRDLAEGNSVSLNLGGGLSDLKGFYNVDLVRLEGVDIVADLNEPLGLLPDNSVSHIYSSNTLEHVSNLLGFLSEMHRICRHGARCEIIVPHFANPYYYSDPTHVRQFGLFTMHYFLSRDQQWRRAVPSYYSEIKFKLLDATFHFYKDTLFDHLTTPLVQWVVNGNRFLQHLFERRFCWLWPPAHIRYVIQVEKQGG